MDEKCKKAVAFFKKNDKYHRILKELGEKYKSRGTLGGIIELHELSDDEKMLLCKIDSKFIYSDSAKFTVKNFLKTFENTEIAEADFLDILNGYFGEKLKTNREIKESKASIKEEYFSSFLEQFQGSRAYFWMKYALESKSYGYTLIIKEYEKNKINFKNLLKYVMIACNSLQQNSKKLTRLAIFASNLTKNPHYFDTSSVGGKLLLSYLSYIIKIKIPENSEGENELLYSFGIIKDEISNYTTVSYITAYTDIGVHAGIEGFCEREEPVQLNLLNLSKINFIKCNNNKLFVFENPSVFSQVMERTVDIKPSLLCTSGQLKLASIILLDKIIDKVEKIYYSGDFDPEGIKIAYRLKQKYGDKLEFWQYDVDMYNKIKSQVTFDERRWKQISNINESKLKFLIEEMGKYKACGYQELLIKEYIKDIYSIFKDRSITLS